MNTFFFNIMITSFYVTLRKALLYPIKDKYKPISISTVLTAYILINKYKPTCCLARVL